MNTTFYAIESLLYSLNLLIISDKIYKISINKKGYLIISLLLHTLLCATGFFIDLYFFIILTFLAQAAQIILLKVFSINYKLIGIIETYFFIYSINMVITVSADMIFSFADNIKLQIKCRKRNSKRL